MSDLPSVVVDLEVLERQIANESALLVGHRHIDADVIDVDPDRRTRLLRCRTRGVGVADGRRHGRGAGPLDSQHDTTATIRTPGGSSHASRSAAVE
jgi:hypothetical protein